MLISKSEEKSVDMQFKYLYSEVVWNTEPVNGAGIATLSFFLADDLRQYT